MTSVYPSARVAILDFRYHDNLHLSRGIAAVQTRTDDDPN